MFQVPEGEPTHGLLEHIASLSPGERLRYERGVLAGGAVVVAHEALSDTPVFLDSRRLMRRFRCTVREAAGLAEVFLALEAGPAVVAHYEDEARRVGVARIIVVSLSPAGDDRARLYVQLWSGPLEPVVVEVWLAISGKSL